VLPASSITGLWAYVVAAYSWIWPLVTDVFWNTFGLQEAWLLYQRLFGLPRLPTSPSHYPAAAPRFAEFV